MLQLAELKSIHFYDVFIWYMIRCEPAVFVKYERMRYVECEIRSRKK